MEKKERYIVEIVKIKLNSSYLIDLLNEIVGRVENNQKTFIVTPNPEFVVYSQKMPWFREIINRADFAIPDGIGIVWASKFLTLSPIKERISGIDLMEKLCQEASRKNWTVYLVGGKSGVAKKAFKTLQKRYPGLKGWAEDGPELKLLANSSSEVELKLACPERPRRSRTARESKGQSSPRWNLEQNKINKWVEKINQCQPDLLFVAFGMGKQEKFIWDNWQNLKVKLAMGVGGAFDYVSGQVPRAPKWIQNMGFEWFYRLIYQPWRWKRQLALVEFVGLVIKERLRTPRR